MVSLSNDLKLLRPCARRRLSNDEVCCLRQAGRLSPHENSCEDVLNPKMWFVEGLETQIVCQQPNIFNKYANLHKYPVRMLAKICEGKTSRMKCREYQAAGKNVRTEELATLQDNNNKSCAVKFKTSINQFVN